MNDRQRFIGIMRCEPVDRLPVMALEPFEAPAIERWHTQGLPAALHPTTYLGMARFVNVGDMGLRPVPAFPERVISEDGTYVVKTTALGTTVKCRKTAPSTYYGHVDHPLKTRDDWTRLTCVSWLPMRWSFPSLPSDHAGDSTT